MRIHQNIKHSENPKLIFFDMSADFFQRLKRVGKTVWDKFVFVVFFRTATNARGSPLRRPWCPCWTWRVPTIEVRNTLLLVRIFWSNKKKRVFVKEVPMNQEVYTPWTLSVVFFETWKIERSCKNSTIYINTSMLQRRWKPFPSSKTWKAPFFLYHKVGPRHRSVVNGGAMGL